MCLVKDKRYHVFNRPLVAEEDIVCYKQLYVNYMGEIVTPYTNIPVPTKCIQKNKKKRVPFKPTETLYGYFTFLTMSPTPSSTYLGR